MLVGVAASRTETFRDQNHRLQSKFAYCKLFGVYAGVIFQTLVWKQVVKRRWNVLFRSFFVNASAGPQFSRKLLNLDGLDDFSKKTTGTAWGASGGELMSLLW